MLLPLVRPARADATGRSNRRRRPSRRARRSTPYSRSSTATRRGGEPLPRPQTLDDWRRRASELIASQAAEHGLGADDARGVTSRARMAALIGGFLEREAAASLSVQPDRELLEASFGEDEHDARPPLDLDGFGLHGKIDRVDVPANGDAAGLIRDYKVSRIVTTGANLEKEGKLQPQLYALALKRLWGRRPLGGLYQPLAGTDNHRPRGIARAAEANGPLTGLDLYDKDLLDDDDFEAALDAAAARAREIVAAMRGGEIDRNPIDDRCPPFCTFQGDLPARAGRPHRARARRRRGRGGRGVSGEQLELGDAGGPRRRPSGERRLPKSRRRSSGRAIDARDRDVLLEAGAGTGKTRVLVERYCAAAEQEERGVDAILAFTFTERAAAELRHRIREELSRRATEALTDGDRERAAETRGARTRQRARLDLDDPRLLPTAPRGPPGRPGTRSPLSGAGRRGGRPTRASCLRRGARGAARPAAIRSRPSWLPRCGFPTSATWSARRTTSCAARAASPCFQSRPTPIRRTRSRSWRRRREARARRPRAGAAGPGTSSGLPRRRPSIRLCACPRSPSSRS